MKKREIDIFASQMIESCAESNIFLILFIYY